MGKVMALKDALDLTVAGGKGSALAAMINAGFNVPDGFVVSAAAKIMGKHLAEAVLAAFDDLGVKKVAVRSSAVAEDGARDAWAGQLDTFLNIDRPNLIKAIEDCRRSAQSARAKAYAEQKGLEPGAVAVIVQEMIDSDISGVAFSVNPVTNDKNRMVIEAVRGLADSLVSGEATPDNYIVDRDGAIVDQTLRQAGPLLSRKQIKEVSETVLKLEKHFGFAVDVEWTYQAGELFILQSRPITTLG